MPIVSGAAPVVATHRDRDARLRGMLEAHFDFIWRLVRRLGLSVDRADDAAQQVFVIASQKLDVIEPASERSFLFGTALRVTSDIRRSAAYRREIPHADVGFDVPTNAAQPDEIVEQRRARAMLDAVLEELEIDLRTVFTLYEMEEMTFDEIAEVLEIPRGTVASRLRRAREAFAQALKRMQKTPHVGGAR